MAQAQEKKATPIRAPRVTLATVTKAPVHRAPRVLIHGQPGVGKTTFAADAPSPIFICPEDGIPVSVQGAGRFNRSRFGKSVALFSRISPWGFRRLLASLP